MSTLVSIPWLLYICTDGVQGDLQVLLERDAGSTTSNHTLFLFGYTLGSPR